MRETSAINYMQTLDELPSPPTVTYSTSSMDDSLLDFEDFDPRGEVNKQIVEDMITLYTTKRIDDNSLVRFLDHQHITVQEYLNIMLGRVPEYVI